MRSKKDFGGTEADKGSNLLPIWVGPAPDFNRFSVSSQTKNCISRPVVEIPMEKMTRQWHKEIHFFKKETLPYREPTVSVFRFVLGWHRNSSYIYLCKGSFSVHVNLRIFFAKCNNGFSRSHSSKFHLSKCPRYVTPLLSSDNPPSLLSRWRLPLKNHLPFRGHTHLQAKPLSPSLA